MKKKLKTCDFEFTNIDYPFWIMMQIIGVSRFSLDCFLNAVYTVDVIQGILGFKCFNTINEFGATFEKFYRIHLDTVQDIQYNVSNYLMDAIMRNEYVLLPYHCEKHNSSILTRVLVHGLDTQACIFFSNKKLEMGKLQREYMSYTSFPKPSIMYNNFLLDDFNTVIRIRSKKRLRDIRRFTNCSLLEDQLMNLRKKTCSVVDKFLYDTDKGPNDFMIYNFDFLRKYYLLILSFLRKTGLLEQRIETEFKKISAQYESCRNVVQVAMMSGRNDFMHRLTACLPMGQ